MAQYTYTIYDTPASQGGPAWPSHCGRSIEAETDGHAQDVVESTLEEEAAGLCASDGYEAGDFIYAHIWDESGDLCRTTKHQITAEDLGEDDAEDDAEDEPDHEARLERAAAHVGATDIGDDQWAYYADETSCYYVVSASDLEDLCDYLDDADPSISRDAYSHWCAGTTAAEQPEGWEPGDEALS